MVNYCANPICHKPLHYLREGKIFLFSHKNTSADGSNLQPRMEHFWLCGICMKQWTLAIDSKEDIKLIETKRKRIRASYAAASAAPVS